MLLKLGSTKVDASECTKFRFKADKVLKYCVRTLAIHEVMLLQLTSVQTGGVDFAAENSAATTVTQRSISEGHAISIY